MQIGKPGESAQYGRLRGAEMPAGIRIEQFLLVFSAALKDNNVRLVRLFAPENVTGMIAGVDSFRGLSQLLICQTGSGDADGVGSFSPAFEDAITKNESAPGDADRHDVQSDGQAGPQVKLEQDAPQPHSLRVVQPSPEERHFI
jgi:hypothetical protein